MAVMLSMTALSIENLPESDLIEATRYGDDRAFEELYARYRDRIAAYIHARVRDRGRAEDVGQEVFISALRRLRAGSQEIYFKPWIYEIARNACIDEFRRGQRGREVPLDVGADDAPSGPLFSLAPGPPAAAETKQRLTDLRGAFGGLSESHHELLVLREFEGLSYEEIGARTGMSRQMVESALFRARRKLTDEYEELASGRRCQQIQSAIDAGRAVSARALGVRERRQFARHLSHCQACRMHAHLAGIDESLVSRRRIGAKIAGLLPFPLWRWTGGAGRSRSAVTHAGAHPAALSTLQGVSEPAVAAGSLGGAAVAAAVLALAGAGAVSATAPAHRVHAVVARHASRAPAPAPTAAPGISRADGGSPTPSGRSLARTEGRLHRPGGVRAHRSAMPRPAAPRRRPAARSTHAGPGVPGAGAGAGAAHAPAATSTSTSARASGAGATVRGLTPAPARGVGHVVAGPVSTTLGATASHLAGTLPLAQPLTGLGPALGPSTPALGTTIPSPVNSVAGTVAQASGAAQGAVSATAAGTSGPAAGGSTASVSGAVGNTASAARGLVGSVLHGAAGH